MTDCELGSIVQTSLTHRSKIMNAHRLEELLNAGLISPTEAEQEISWLNMGSDTRTLRLMIERNYRTGEKRFVVEG